MDNQTFNKVKTKHFQTLEQYVPIVARVHGKSHPEFYDVQKVFDVITEKTKKARSRMPELNEEFAALRKITSNYKVPEDTCESFEAVYAMLAELDQAYYA